MAVNTEQQYLSQLYQIQSHNPPSIALLTSADVVYDIDLTTRSINSPQFLSVEQDHQSETIYFRVDRYNDYMDLSNTICIIQYLDAQGGSHIYPVPFYDIMTEHNEDKMIFPWCIDGAATQYTGTVEYSIKFYRIEEIEGKPVYAYILNTVPAKSKVLHGMDTGKLPNSPSFDAKDYEYLLQLIGDINKEGVYWDIYE